MEDILCKGIALILRLGVTFVAGGNEGGSLSENLLLLFWANEHKQPEAQADAWGPAPVGAHHAIASGYIYKYDFQMSFLALRTFGSQSDFTLHPGIRFLPCRISMMKPDHLC